MSAARPSHAFALVPFSPDAVTGCDAVCERAVDAWCLSHGKEYSLDAPRIVAEFGKFFMYVSGALKELVLQQSELQLQITVEQQDRANAINEARQSRVQEARVVTPGASLPRLPQPRR